MDEKSQPRKSIDSSSQSDRSHEKAQNQANHDSTRAEIGQPLSPKNSAKSQDGGELGRTKTQDEIDDESREYPSSWKLAVITLALCLAVFCFALDNVSTVRPSVSQFSR